MGISIQGCCGGIMEMGWRDGGGWRGERGEGRIENREWRIEIGEGRSAHGECWWISSKCNTWN
jgi:hypothetical protein